MTVVYDSVIEAVWRCNFNCTWMERM